MKFLHSFITLALCSSMAFVTSAQLSMPTQTIGNTRYYYHKVKKKETLYGVAKKYGITQDDIIKYNPSAKDGLKTNQILFFPVDAFAKPSADKTGVKLPATQKVAVVTHTVEKGETLYGLSRIYGTSIDAIKRANPIVADGLKVGQVITIPQDESFEVAKAKPSIAEAKESNSEIVYHRIQAGETLYYVSRYYNTTIAAILELNPGISAENFRIGEVIRIQPNDNKAVMVEKPITKFVTHELKEGESFTTVASDNNIDVKKIIDANPGVKAKKGSIINIPVAANDTVVVRQSELDDKNAKATITSKSNADTINVAIVMPFMLHQASPSASALNNTEFLKGFLMAVDDVRRGTRKHINVTVHDNRNSLAATDSILHLPGMKQMNMIIAPSDAKQLDATNKFCKQNDILSVNLFAIKDESYATNSFSVQTNIPHSYLSAELCEWYDKKFDNRSTIFINPTNAKEEKDVCHDLKKHLQKQKSKTASVTIDSDFNYDSVNNLLVAGNEYVIIPSSSSKAMLTKLIPILKRIKQERADVDFVLMGYPEYTTYLLEMKDDFHAIDTYIYSRFFYDEKDSKTRNFEQEYSKWYGEEMRYVVPRFGLLGYDTGKFFLQTLANVEGGFNNRVINEYNGLQTSFKLQRLSNWSGFINKDLQFIHFTTHNTIER